MTSLLVVSDSHVHNATLQGIFQAHPDISICLHCGDIQDDPASLKIETLYLVQGNTDVPTMPKELVIEIDHYQILIVHGHGQVVEDGLDDLVAYGKTKNVDLICYGHTHHPMVAKRDDLTILNPGSVAFPRGGKVFVPTYAIVDLGDDLTIHFYHAKTHACVDDLVLGSQTKKKKKSFFSFLKR